MYQYLPYGPFKTLAAYLTFLEDRRRDPDTIIYVIRDISKPGRALAGVIGYLNTSKPSLSLEIGHITILPRYQVKLCPYYTLALRCLTELACSAHTSRHIPSAYSCNTL